jgi:hypothetical protein
MYILCDNQILDNYFYYILKFRVMVRRHGKKQASTCEEKKKRERGESSASADGLGPRAPKQGRREEQRHGAHEPGSSFFYPLFKLKFRV